MSEDNRNPNGPPQIEPLKHSNDAIKTMILEDALHAEPGSDTFRNALSAGLWNEVNEDQITAKRMQLQREAQAAADEAWHGTPSGARHAAQQQALANEQKANDVALARQALEADPRYDTVDLDACSADEILREAGFVEDKPAPPPSSLQVQERASATAELRRMHKAWTPGQIQAATEGVLTPDEVAQILKEEEGR